ncbi:MAG: DinB family protein [Gammaproteobacteria bacterium]|nr:DinB family protein [Gammaproteobacteria bacterium]
MKDYFVDQARYQAWAMNELFKSLDTLDDEQRRADRGLFFRDIHKTVDHILVCTRNWKYRLQDQADKATGYDVLLYSDWDQLKQAVVDEFNNIHDWLDTQADAWFAGDQTYTSAGNQRTVAVADGLIHIMTHAVHHRGQISTVCTQLGAPCPEMDFVYYRWRA